jgi:imidazolonepropionase-like amidohydrolase
MAIVIKAARIFDGKSDGLLHNSSVVVEGDKIAGLVATGHVPSGADLVDLGDVTLSPGFIDAHTHLTVAAEAYDQFFIHQFRQHVAERAYLAALNARVTLEAGFTTVRDVGCIPGSNFVDVSLRNAIAQGLVPGPRMLVARNLIGATGGHCDFTGGLSFRATGRELDYTDGVADGPSALRQAVRFNVKHGADLIKFCASGGVLSLADEVDTPQLTLEEMTAVVDEAHRLRKRVAVHCHGDHAAKEAILAGVESIEHGSFLQGDTLSTMKSKGTYLVPTLFALEWLTSEGTRLPPAVETKALAAKASHSEVFRRAVELGVRIGYGTDASVFPHGMNAKDFAIMVGLGMSPAAALRTATSVNAELLGVENRLGTLEEGKVADIVAMPGDPIDDITVTERVSFVMKEGTIVKSQGDRLSTGRGRRT